MTRLARLVLLFGVMVAAATAASSAQAATWKHCGDAGVTQHVQAKKLNCFTARLVAERHAGMCGRAKAKCQIDFYACKRATPAAGRARVTCRWNTRAVRFHYGAA